MGPFPLPSRRRSIRRALRRHRRPLAALTAACALWAGLRAVAPPPPATVGVAVAARDLPAGAALTAADVGLVAIPVAAVPDGATAPSDGTLLLAPVRRGEPFTDVRLSRGRGLVQPAGTVIVTVRTADPAATLAVRPGDRVDVLAGSSSAPVGGTVGTQVGGSGGPGVEGTTIGVDLLVLAVPGRPDGDPSGVVAGSVVGVPGVQPLGPVDEAGLLGAVGPTGPDPGAVGAGEVDTAGVLVVAADRRAAAGVAAASGVRPLNVVVVSRQTGES